MLQDDGHVELDSHVCSVWAGASVLGRLSASTVGAITGNVGGGVPPSRAPNSLLGGPRELMGAVLRSAAASKQRLRGLSAQGWAADVVIINGPSMLASLVGLGGRLPNSFNVAISNVPEPRRPLYDIGVRLDSMYPISLLTHGAALNITCMSYAGTLNFGFVGARDTLHMGQAFDELRLLLLPKRGRWAAAAHS